MIYWNCANPNGNLIRLSIAQISMKYVYTRGWSAESESNLLDSTVSSSINRISATFRLGRVICVCPGPNFRCCDKSYLTGERKICDPECGGG